MAIERQKLQIAASNATKKTTLIYTKTSHHQCESDFSKPKSATAVPVMTDTQDYLVDGSPLITAAHLGKLRLARLLVEGGAQVNERNQRGETPLLAACRALRGDQTGTTMLRLIKFLLNNQADPNIQDKAGRTALMYACMERAGVEVVSALVAAGADPSLEDYSGASALVYAINAHDQDTLQVLMDTCRSTGRDIIIIATDLSCDGSSVTRRYLNVLPSPDTSPVSCMSPSDIELKTNSPNSDGENIFNFRGSGAGSPVLSRSNTRYRQRLHSEPWLAIQNLAHLSRTYEKNLEDTFQENENEKNDLQHSTQTCSSLGKGFPRTGQVNNTDIKPKGPEKCCRNTMENPLGHEQLQNRRNTLPDLQGQSLLQLPSVKLTLSSSDTHLHDPSGSSAAASGLSSPFHFPSIYRTSSLLLAPPAALQDCKTLNRKKPQDQLSPRCLSRSGFLPPLQVNATASLWPVCRNPNADLRPSASQETQKGNNQFRRHSVQLEQIRQTGSSEESFLLQ